MLLHEFPDLPWLKAQAETRFANRRGIGGTRLPNQGWPTVVLNTLASQVVRDNILGPLSIFTNLSGCSEVSVGNKSVKVSPETFFISNAGQHYTLEIQEKSATETFNIHFGQHFAETALQSILSSPDRLLENTSAKPLETFGFHNRISAAGNQFKKIIQSIRIEDNNPLHLEEQLFLLLNLLVSGQKDVHTMRDRLTALKVSTKEEILKRLLTATDYLYTYYDMNPGLDELAAVSCLSKFHFLRLFKIAYGQTPHQFITTLKVRKAKHLLRSTNDEVKAIADALGFENSSSFSRLFHREVGYYPTQYRQTIR